MQITAITLGQLRRFTDPVTITGLGPGLNVLSEPNEAGKSTLFDALYAVFFRSHRSFDKAVKALVPRVGGDPSVTVDFTLDGASWRLTKVWSSSPARRSARLWRDGTLIAQKDEAEAHLATLIGAPSDGGPAGLLWVRQGVVDQTEDKDEQAARRSILDSVAGEVEAMTGGHRMARALDACDAVLKQHLTNTGRVKTGGGLALAQAEAEALDQTRADLTTRVAALQDDLDRRRRATRELGELTDPQAEADRTVRLADAQQALTAAQARQSRVDLAQGKIRELQARAAQTDQQISALTSALTEARAATEALAQAQTDHTAAAKTATDTRQNVTEVTTHHDQARTASDLATARARQVLRAEAAQAAEAQRADLTARIARADDLRTRIEDHEARAAQELSPDALKPLDDLETRLRMARHVRAASAASLTFHPAPMGQGAITRDGAALPEATPQPIPDGATLDIAGIGRLVISPGASASDADVTKAQEALTQALTNARQPDIETARASATRATQIRADIQAMKADLTALAPDGLADLRARLAALPEPIPLDPDLPPRTEAEAQETQTRDALQQAAEALRAAQVMDEAAQSRLQTATAARDIAADRHRRATDALTPEPEAALSTQKDTRAALQTQIDAAQKDLDALQTEASDLTAAETAVTRAQSVIDNTRRAVATLREDLAQLNARIGLTASEAPEEELALVTDRLSAAQSRLAAIETEVAVNQRLHTVLSEAQAEAREAYVKPVHAELAPLLRMLWPDADPVIDAETGMITAITRRTVEEDIDMLSGGTREQISLLVRLAFARLLAARGQPAPVILDDAIVYTDDDRIEQIFNALTAGGEALQVIVLTCRQRAFRALGGRILTIAPAPEGA